MFGAIVRVLVVLRLVPEVTLKYNALAGSAAPSATVVVTSPSELNAACVLNPSASAISSRLVFVLVGHPIEMLVH